MKEWSNFFQGELWHSVSSDEKFFAMDAEFFDVSKKPMERASHDEKSECCGVRAENSDASFV